MRHAPVVLVWTRLREVGTASMQQFLHATNQFPAEEPCASSPGFTRVERLEELHAGSLERCILGIRGDFISKQVWIGVRCEEQAKQHQRATVRLKSPLIMA